MARRARSRRLPRVHQGPCCVARAGRRGCDALGDHQGAVHGVPPAKRSSRPTLPCTYGRETTLWQWSAGGKCLASAKHPPMAPSSGTVWWEALAGQAVSSVPRASCRRRWTCGWVLPTANLLGPDLADMLEARPSPAAGRSDARGRQGRAVPNVYVDQRRGALIVVWERRWKGACRPRLRHSMSSVQSRGTRPNRRSPLESCRLPGLRSLAPPSSARHALWAGRELPAVTGRRQPVLTPM